MTVVITGGNAVPAYRRSAFGVETEKSRFLEISPLTIESLAGQLRVNVLDDLLDTESIVDLGSEIEMPQEMRSV